jgi:hypothetical protein
MAKVQIGLLERRWPGQRLRRMRIKSENGALRFLRPNASACAPNIDACIATLGDMESSKGQGERRAAMGRRGTFFMLLMRAAMLKHQD